MPNSLRSRLNTLRHKGQITTEECEALKLKLDNHDKELRNKVINAYMYLLCEHCIQQKNECYNLDCPFCEDSCEIVNIAEQLKAGGV